MNKRNSELSPFCVLDKLKAAVGPAGRCSSRRAHRTELVHISTLLVTAATAVPDCQVTLRMSKAAYSEQRNHGWPTHAKSVTAIRPMPPEATHKHTSFYVSFVKKKSLYFITPDACRRRPCASELQVVLCFSRDEFCFWCVCRPESVTSRTRRIWVDPRKKQLLLVGHQRNSRSLRLCCFTPSPADLKITSQSHWQAHRITCLHQMFILPLHVRSNEMLVWKPADPTQAIEHMVEIIIPLPFIYDVFIPLDC